MTRLIIFAKVCVLASFLTACIGCGVNHRIQIRVNSVTGKEDLIVSNGDTVSWVDEKGNVPPIHFKVPPPCNPKDIQGNSLKNGVCHVSAKSPGDYIYDCGGYCGDPDMPVRSHTSTQAMTAPIGDKPAGTCFNRTVLLQLPATAVPASDTVAANSCVLWESSIATKVTISDVKGAMCSLTTGTDSAAGPCDLAGATFPVTYTYSQGDGRTAVSSSGTINLSGASPNGNLQ